MSSVTNEERSLPLLVAILVGLFYASSLTFGFVYDDAEIILNRPALRSWFEIGRLFLQPYYDGLPYYRPIPAALFAIERLLFGTNPWPYHATNVAIAMWSAMVMFRLYRNDYFGMSARESAFLSFFVLIHPVMSSVVYMLSGREALLAMNFGFTAVNNGLCLRRTRCSLAILLALWCRESAVAFVPILALVFFTNRRGGMLSSITALVVPTTIYFAFRGIALHNPPPSAFLNDPAAPVFSFMYALRCSVLPFWNLLYEPMIVDWFNDTAVVVSIVALVLITVSFKQSDFLEKLKLTGVIACCGFLLLPTANILVQETPFDERHVAMALPLIVYPGFIVIQKVGNDQLRWISPLRMVLIAAVMTCSANRSTAFATDRSFIMQQNQLAARSSILHFRGSLAYIDGKTELALSLFRQAQLRSDNVRSRLAIIRLFRHRGDLGSAFLHADAATRKFGREGDLEKELRFLKRLKRTTEEGCVLKPIRPRNFRPNEILPVLTQFEQVDRIIRRHQLRLICRGGVPLAVSYSIPTNTPLTPHRLEP